MSQQKIDLALAFLESKPAGAAAVLEQQSAEQVAGFLRDSPHGHAAAVLEKMLPQYVADICRQLEPAVSARFLSEMDIDLVVAVLRYSDDRLTGEVLEHLPERTKITCRLLLQYSAEAVGAWMVANIMTLPHDCTAQEARERLASDQDSLEGDSVYVVDRERKVQGSVDVGSLLRAAPDTPITSMMKENSEAISGRVPLVTAANHPVWSHGDTVAVINRNQQIVGMLRHADLRKGLGAISNTIGRTSGHSPFSGAVEVYGHSLLTLFSTLCEAAAVPGTPRGDHR